jgi:hypothetical protein
VGDPEDTRVELYVPSSSVVPKVIQVPEMLNPCLRTWLMLEKNLRKPRCSARTKNHDLESHVFFSFEHLKSKLERSHGIFHLKEEPVVQEYTTDATWVGASKWGAFRAMSVVRPSPQKHVLMTLMCRR